MESGCLCGALSSMVIVGVLKLGDFFLLVRVDV